MNNKHALILIAFTLGVLVSCGSSSGQKKATVFAGGAIAAFGGDNGGDSTVRQVARDVMDLRTFDLIADTFTLANGAVSSAALGGGSFGHGQGTQILGVDKAAVLLNITSGDQTITDVKLSGDYDISFAQRAIDTPGAQFTASWRLSYQSNGMPRVITFDQTMTGGQFASVP